MARRQGGTLSGFTPLSTPNAPTGLSVSTSIGSATVSFTAPTDTGDGAITSYIVTAIDESTGASTGATGSASPITISPGGGTFKIRAQAVNGFGPGRLTEFSTGHVVIEGAELYAWGRNTNGAIGDNTDIDRSSPVQVGALTNWAAISAARHSLARDSGNKLWAWGYGANGRLGLGDTANRSSPTQVGALTNWAQPAAGLYHSAAVKTDGTLWTWGSNSNSQLGGGVTRSSPAAVGAGLFWVQVTAGRYASLAITSSGELYSWGTNSDGQLGLGDTTNRSTPTRVGLLSNWSSVAISLSNQFTTAVKTDGTLWTWGLNTRGFLGDGTTDPKSSPVQIGALTNWKQTAGGVFHTLAVKTDDTLWAWGSNNNFQSVARGQLGTNDNIDRSSPVQVGALADWQNVSAGFYHGAAAKTDGTLWTWGQNDQGQLGDGTTANRSSPVQVGALAGWLIGSAGANHTVALGGVV